MRKLNAILMSDGYKSSHHLMYPLGTNLVYSNYTPRSVKYMPDQAKQVVVFGTQYTIKYIKDLFDETFFSLPKDEVIGEAKKYLSSYLGSEYNTKHFEELHDLGYLPVEIKCLEEGTVISEKIPLLTIKNTLPQFFWVTNYLETLISSLLWKPLHSASMAYGYRKILDKYAKKTDPTNSWLVDFQGHDFSFRGMQHPEAAISSGLGFISVFKGSDTIPVLKSAEYYYNEPSSVFSVPASEHAVMTAYGKENEIDAFRRLLKQFPTGILSVVSDSFDLWKVCTEYVTELKEEILSRDGKLVLRPDCYSEDTLILTPDGWKEFNQLTTNSLVAQVNEDGTYSFVKPLKIVNEDYNGIMYHFKDFHGKMDLIVTPNHRMVYKQFDKWKIDFAEDCKPNNYTKYFIRSARAENKFKKLTNNERLNIAFQADGSKCTDNNKNIRFNFSKVRKIQRLKALLDDMELPYKEYNLDDGRVEINVEYPLESVSKNFDWVITSDLCSNWCQEFIEELSHWDSCIRNKNKIKFDTTNVSVSKVVELIALSAGYGCLTSKYEDGRKEIFSNVYTSHILLDNKLGGQSVTVEKIQYNGKIVCVTVPTGKIVIKRNRCTMVCGNSGNPVDIICGLDGKHYEQKMDGHYYKGDKLSGDILSQTKGVVELLWDVFGGTINEQGFKVLNPCIGTIYGDSISLERAENICKRLEEKGFASTNVVYGIGSFSMGYATRDNQGGAVKAVYCEVNGVGREIFKDPVTDNGTKKSAKGLLKVDYNENGEITLYDQVSWEEEQTGLLQTVFKDGKLVKESSLQEIRDRILKTIN